MEFDQQRTQGARPLCTGLAIQMKSLGAHLLRSVRAAVYALSQSHQQLSRILKVTPPQQGDTLTGEPIRLIGRGLVVGNHHAARGRRSTLGNPARTVRRATFRPMNDCRGAQAGPRSVSYRISRRARPPTLISFSLAGFGAKPAAA